MDDSQLRETISKIVCQVLDREFELLAPEVDLVKELTADSMDLVEIAAKVEDAFHFDAEGIQKDQVRTIGQIVSFVKGHVDGGTVNS